MSETAPVPALVLVDVDGVIRALGDTVADLEHWPAESWQRNRVAIRWAGFTVTVTHSTAVIDRLRRIEAMPHTAMTWCTSWRNDAAASLAPVIGLGEDWPIVGHDLPEELQWTGWWKAARVYEATRTHKRVVWVDDDAARWVEKMRAAELGEWLNWLDERVLIISPDRRRGLTSEHLDAIENFLAPGASEVTE
ncbi:hypothetical protein QQX10_10605 [Demequina sp. SYSU T00039]|uniref:Secreted protein n=1 Tax=Demequina lignilytica TaxID=3051663 RepID=A0AAW7MA83_9MICO|nr:MULTISPECIES: hypothetical protein [unclassified Demequina]MDN4478639.1 hypothetical protein [Demequina sp. SYSU T00039-1]MDN4488617.1 hypothetical protein [Demequina sp. SYSU T00039]